VGLGDVHLSAVDLNWIMFTCVFIVFLLSTRLQVQRCVASHVDLLVLWHRENWLERGVRAAIIKGASLKRTVLVCVRLLWILARFYFSLSFFSRHH